MTCCARRGRHPSGAREVHRGKEQKKDLEEEGEEEEEGLFPFNCRAAVEPLAAPSRVSYVRCPQRSGSLIAAQISFAKAKSGGKPNFLVEFLSHNTTSAAARFCIDACNLHKTSLRTPPHVNPRKKRGKKRKKYFRSMHERNLAVILSIYPVTTPKSYGIAQFQCSYSPLCFATEPLVSNPPTPAVTVTVTHVSFSSSHSPLRLSSSSPLLSASRLLYSCHPGLTDLARDHPMEGAVFQMTLTPLISIRRSLQIYSLCPYQLPSPDKPNTTPPQKISKYDEPATSIT